VRFEQRKAVEPYLHNLRKHVKREDEVSKQRERALETGLN